MMPNVFLQHLLCLEDDVAAVGETFGWLSGHE